MEKLKERKELDPKDCWDLTKVIQDEKEYQKLIQEAKECNLKIVHMKGHILNNASSLQEYLELSEKESRILGRLQVYTKFLFDEDQRNNESKAKLLEISSLINELSEQESFIVSEFMEKDLSDVLKFLEEKEELKKYRLYFERLYKDKKRILSEKEEAIIAKATSAFGTPEEAFEALDTADASFGKIQLSARKKVELTQYNYSVLLSHEKQQVRKDTFQTFYRFYENHKHTFASCLKGNYQELEFLRKIRSYSSALEMALDSISVTPNVYQNLIASVNQYMDLNVEYQKIKHQLLNVKEYHLYDTYVPVVKKPKEKYTKEEAHDLIVQALQPLGEDYLAHFEAILQGHTVDFYSNVGKYTGAYHWGCYDSPSYVLLNFDGTFDEVSTFAHEMGHAVHSMYSKENNPYLYSSYEIFLAEIASTVNETFLCFYQLDHAKKKNEKIYYLCEFLDRVKATIYRQTMFAEFERIMSEKMQKKESLTEEVFSEVYYQLNQQYFKDSVIIDPEIRYEWMRIPHFYTPFYVYQYATGLISALCIVKNILSGEKDAREKYLRFLKGGDSKDVLDLLKDVGVDLTTKKPFEQAFSLIQERLDELKKLVLEGGESL